MRFLLVIITTCLMGISLQAQQNLFIKGQITENQQKTGVPFALVKVNDTYTYADLNGYFEVNIPSTGEVWIEAQQIGYEASRYLISKDFQQVNIALPVKAIILEEVLVSDQATPQPQSDIIADPSKAITQARDVGDLFNSIPGFSLIKKGGYALDPVFRSFKYEQLNVIYDGGIQTTYACPGRMDPTTTHINPQQVEKIELIRGPFSVRYGASLGGIVNVVTHVPDRTQLGWSGSLEGGYETNGSGKSTKVNLNSVHNKFDFGISAGLKDYGNYESGNGNMIPSAFRTYDYDVKAAFNPDEHQRLQVSWRQAFNRDVLHAGLAMDTDYDNSDFISLDYTYNNLSPKLYSLSFKAYGTQVEHLMTNSRRPNFMMLDAQALVTAETYGAKAEITWLPSPKTIIYAGSDLRSIHRDGTRTRIMKRNMMTGEELPIPMTMQDAIWQNSSINDLGWFVESKYLMNPNWSLLVGARLDWVSSQTKEPAADFEQLYPELDKDQQFNLSTTASISYQAPSDWNIQLALGRGVRSPNMIERYINHFTVGQDAYEYVGNPNLQPEVNNQIEFSIQKKNDKASFSANIFYSYLQDYITAEVDPDLPRKYMGALPNARRFTNIDKAIQYGFEIGGNYSLSSNLALHARIQMTEAQNLDWEEPLAEIAPMEAILGIRYEQPKWWLAIQSRLVDDQDRISQRFQESSTPGFTTFDLRAAYQINEDLNFGMAIINILDRQYREHLNRSYRNASQSGVIFEPGRNFTFFAKYKF